ncbi:MAG: alpha/beta hydrolase [Acidimicrobiales bacterium]|nr:alpha/beta hydrolase [Acidimicrobiales bacterium]
MNNSSSTSVLVDQRVAHYRTGGVPLKPEAPVVLLVHGAGMDGTIWSQQTRYLGMRGVNAVAVDLPGHGLSGGTAISSIAGMADWLVRFCDTVGLEDVVVVGHSMGTFIALEMANRFPKLVRSVALLGTATDMPVHPELLDAAKSDLARAAALMAGWSYATDSRIGLNPTPGLWMSGGCQALVERSKPGVLFNDLKACAAYTDAAARAASLPCDALVVIGREDKMTPPKSGRSIAEAMVRSTGVKVLELPSSGHMMMTEAPRIIREALLEAAQAAPLSPQT